MGLEQEQRERIKEEENRLGARPLIFFIILRYGDLTQMISILTAILRDGGHTMTGLLGSQTLEVRFRGSQPDARGCRHLPQWGPQTSSRA